MRRGAVLVCGLFVLLAVAGGATIALRAEPDPILYTVAVGQGIGAGGIVADPRSGRSFVAAGLPLYRGAPTNTITMLVTRTGALLRRVPVGNSTPYLALDASHNHVLAASVGATAGALSLLDGTSGAILRTVSVGTMPLALAVDERTNRAFLASGGGGACAYLPLACHRDPTTVSVLDTRTLRLLRTVRVGRGPRAITVDERGGRVFVADASSIDVLDASSGRLLFTISGASEMLAVDRRTGHIVVSAGGGLVRVLDARGRRILHSASLHGSIVGGAAAVDERTGHIWVATVSDFPTLTGRIDVLDGSSGRLLHSIPVGPLPDMVSVDTRARRAFALSQLDGTLSVIDIRTWRVVQTLPVGLSPMSIAVDDAAGRVIVGAMETAPIQHQDIWSWVPQAVRHWLPFPAPVAPEPSRPGGVTVLSISH